MQYGESDCFNLYYHDIVLIISNNDCENRFLFLSLLILIFSSILEVFCDREFRSAKESEYIFNHNVLKT